MCLVYGNDGLFKGLLKDNMSRLKADPWSILCSRPGVWRQSSEGSFKGRWPINNAAVIQLTQKILEVEYLIDSLIRTRSHGSTLRFSNLLGRGIRPWGPIFKQSRRRRRRQWRKVVSICQLESEIMNESRREARVGFHHKKGYALRLIKLQRPGLPVIASYKGGSFIGTFIRPSYIESTGLSAYMVRQSCPPGLRMGGLVAPPGVLLTLLILTFFVYCQSPLWLDLRCESGTRDIIVKLLRDEAVFLRRRILLDAQKPSIWWKYDIFLFRKEWAESFFRPNSWNEFRMLHKSTIQLPSVYVYLMRTSYSSFNSPLVTYWQGKYTPISS